MEEEEQRADFWARTTQDGTMMRGDVPKLLNYARCWNRVYFTEKFKSWFPVFVCGEHSGFVTPEMKAVVGEFPDIFDVSQEAVNLRPDFKTLEERSNAIGRFVNTLRNRRKPSDPFYKAFDFWRNEMYDIWGVKHDIPLLEMERACMCLLGFRHYAVFVNGYVNHPERGLCVWFQRRALNKTTWPGKWDVMAGGGTGAGQKIRDAAIREVVEEASIPASFVDSRAKFAGSVSFFHEDPRGIFPNVYHVFDLELRLEDKPEPGDGEASEFQLMNGKDALDLVCSPDFKMTSGPVAVDFLMRHGVISPDLEPFYSEVVEHLHAPLHVPYGCFRVNPMKAGTENMMKDNKVNEIKDSSL